MQRKWNTEHWTVTFGELSTERAFCLEMRSRKLCGCSVFFLFFFSSRRKLAARLDRTEGASDSKPGRVAGKSFPRFGCWARTRNRQVASPQKIFVGYSAQIGESCAPAKRLRCGKGRVTGPPVWRQWGEWVVVCPPFLTVKAAEFTPFGPSANCMANGRKNNANRINIPCTKSISSVHWPIRSVSW